MDTLTEPRLDAIESKFNSIEFRAHAHLVSEYNFAHPLSVKGPFSALRRIGRIAGRARGRRRARRMGPSADLGLPGIGRQARTNIPYKRDARDADGDGLLQEGTIWERNVGSRIHAEDGGEMAAGAPASALAGQRHTVRNAAGQTIQYKPGQDPKSPLRRGRAGAQRVVRRAGRRHYQADRDVETGRAHREAVSVEDQQRRLLENAIAVESFNRWMEAEEQRRGQMGDDQRDWLDGMMEGWSGVRQGMKKKPKGSAARRKLSKVHRKLIIAEGERRFRRTRAGIENEEEDWEDEEEFDDKVLPAGVDREEHNRKMREDPEYRAEFIRSLMDMEAKENRDKEYVHPPGYVSQPGDEDYEFVLPEKEPRHLPGGMKVPLPTTPWDERDPDDGWEVDEDGKIVEKRNPRDMRVVDLTDEELAAEIKRLKGRGKDNLKGFWKDRFLRLRREKSNRDENAAAIAAIAKEVEDAATAEATEEARAKLEKVMMLLASRFKNNPELMSYDEKKRYLDSLDRPELEEIYKDITGFDAAKSWSRTGPKTPNLVDKIIKSKEPPPKVIDPDELDDDQYRLYLQRLKPGKLYDEASTHLVKNRGKHRKDPPDEFIKLIVAARKERREISDIANMDPEAITAERNALLKGKNPEKLTHEELARIAVLDDALKDGVEDSLMAYMEYLKETKGKLRNDLKKRLKAKPDEAATPKKTPKKTPEPAGPVDDSGKPIPPPPKPADVVPEDVVPEDVVPEDVVPEEALEELAPDLVGPRETHDPGGTFTWAAGRPFENLTNDELDYEIRRQLSYETDGGPHDLIKHAALDEEWGMRNPDSDEGVNPLGDETPEERAIAIRGFQEAMRDEAADEWEAVAEGLGVLREDLDTDVLPDFKFWSAEEDEKEELFGKYYHVSGELNDRGVLLNERIVGKEEDEVPEVPEDEAAIVEQIEEVDDAVREIQDTARDRREPTPSPVPDDSRFTPTVEEGDIRISENVIIHSSNTDDDVRPMLLVQMPDGTIQAFYKRTGSGSEATPGEVEQIEAEGGGGAGNWVPFDGFGGRLGKNWFRKGESDPQEGGPLFRYGTEELKAAGQALDASENVQAMLDDPDRQVHIVHSDPSRVGGELMLDPDDPTIQKTSEELNEILGLPSTEEYTASLVKPEDVDVPEDVPEPKITLEDAPKFTVKEAKEGDEWRVHARSENGRLIAERRNAEDSSRDGFFSLTKQAYGENVYAIGKHQPDWKNKPYSGAAAWSKETGKWTFFLNGDEPWSGAEAPEADVPKDVPEPEAATPKPKVKRPSVPEFRVSAWDSLNDGTEYRVVLYSEEENKAVIERRGGKGRAGFYMLQPGKREGDYDATYIRDFSSDRREKYVGRTFRSIDAPWPDGTPEEAPEVEEVAEVTAPDFWTDLPEGLSAEDVNQLMIDKRQERVDAGKLPNVDDESLDDEIRAEIMAEHTAPKPKAEPKKPKVKPKPEVVPEPPETPASLAETDEMEFYFGGPLPSTLTSGDFDETLESLRARDVTGLTKSEKEQHQNRLALFETHQTLSTGKPIEVIAAMNALLRHDEELAVDPPDWEKQAILTRIDEAIQALNGRAFKWTEPRDVMQRRELLERRRQLRDATFDVEVADEDEVPRHEDVDADVPDSTPEFDLTREELEEIGKQKGGKDELLKLVEDERDNGRTLKVNKRTSNANIIDALLDTSEDDDDDTEALRPGAAKFDADRGDIEVDDEEPVSTVVSTRPKGVPEVPTRLRKLRDDVNRLAKYEERIKAHQADKKLGVGLSDAEIKDHKELKLLVPEDAEELADLEATEARRLQPKPETLKAVRDRVTAIKEFHAETAGTLSEEEFEEWLDARKAAKPAERSAKGDRRTANAEELRALRAEYQAKRATERGKFRRIWDKLKAMTKADRRLVKLDRESSEEKKDRLARVQVLRAKNVLTADEKLELRDLEDVEAAQVVNPMMRGAEQTRVRTRERLNRLTWEDANGVSSSLEDLSDEELVGYRELPEDTAKQTLSFTGGFVLLLDRSDARDGPDGKVNKDRGVWRLALDEEEGKADGLKKRTERAAAAQIAAMKAARKAGKSEGDVFAEGAVARATVEQEDIVPSTHREIKRTEIKEILMELEDALKNKLLAEAGIDIDERVTKDSKWASEFGMSSTGGADGDPVLIGRTGTTAGRKAKIPARYVDGSEKGTKKKTRKLDAVTLDDGEAKAVGAALEDYPVDVVLEVLPSTPFWDVPEDGSDSEDDPATVELFSRYYSETADEGLFLNDRGLWVNNVLNGLADPSEVELEKQSAEIPAVEASPRLLLSDAKRFVTTGKRKPDSEPRDDIVKNLEEGKGEGGPKSAFKKRMIEVPKDRAEIDSMVRLLAADEDADNPYESDRGDPPLAGAPGDDRTSQWGNVARRGARNVEKANRKSKTVRKAIEEAARRKREETESLPPPAPTAEDHPDKRLQEMIGIRENLVAKVQSRLDDFPEFDDGTEDPAKRVLKYFGAADREADVLRARRAAYDIDPSQPFSEEEEERLEQLEQYLKDLAQARRSVMNVRSRLRTLSGTGRDDPPLTEAEGFRPRDWDDADREEREIFEAEFRETMAGMTLEQVEAIADGRVVWEGPDPFDDQRATVRLLRRLARIEARRRRAEAFPVSEPEAPMSHDDRLRKILTDMGVSDEMADDPLFRQFAMLTAVTQIAEKSEIDEPVTPEQERIYQTGGWRAFSEARGYTDREIQDFAMWLEVKDEIDEKYPTEGTSPHPETGEPVPWASTSLSFVHELVEMDDAGEAGDLGNANVLAEMWTEDLDADWKRAHGMHVGEWSNPNDEKYGRRTVDNTLRQGPNWPPGLDPGTVGDDMSIEELHVLGTEILKAIRFNTLEDEGIEVDENERAAHLRHSLHTLNNELLEDVLLGVYKRLEREADGFERGSDAPGYPPIRPRSDEQVEWDRMAEEMETWTEEQWEEAAEQSAQSMVDSLRDWLEANPDENPLHSTGGTLGSERVDSRWQKTGDRDPWVPGENWTPERRRAIANARRQDLERRDPEYAETVAMHRELVREMSDEVLRAEVDRIVALPAIPPDERDGYINVLEELGERADRQLRHEQNLPPEGADIRTAITEDDGEYTVRLFINGVHQAGADYFTDDLEEAEETAKAMEADAHISDKTTESAEDEAATFDQLEIDGRSIPLSLDWADDPEVQRLHDAMYPPEKAMYYGEKRSQVLEEARQYDPEMEEAIIYETYASTLVEAEFLTDAQIDEQIRRLGDIPGDDQISDLLRGFVPSTMARPMSDDPEVIGRLSGLQAARMINFSLKEQFAQRETRIRAEDMSVDELNALIERLESERDTGMFEMEFNGIVLFGDDDRYLLDRRIEALKEMVHYKQKMDPHGESFWDDGSGDEVVLPPGVEREVGPYPFILTDEGDLEYIPNLTGPTDALDADFDASIANLLRNEGPTVRADALVDMLKRLKAHEGELDPDMYRASRKRHMDQLGEAISEMTPKEQDEYLAGLGNFFHEMGITSQRQGEGDGLDLSGHNLPDGDWTNTDFKSMGVDPDQGFREANFGGSDLSRGNFRGVDLRGADFRGADLSEADFTGADLRGANFDGADLAGVNFTGANIEGVIWGNSTPDDNTIWPDDGYPGFDSDPPLTGGVPRGPNTAGRGGPLRDRRGRFIDRVFDPDADYTFEDLEKWTMPELEEAARSLKVPFAEKTKKKLIEDILKRQPPRGGRAPVGGRGAANAEPSQAQQLDMLRNQYRNAETIGDQDEMDRIADELRGLGSQPVTRRRKPDRGRRIDRPDPPLTGTVPSPFDRRGVERTDVNEAMERYEALGLEELDLEGEPRSYSAQRLRDLKSAREVLFGIEEDPTLPRGLRDQARGDIRALRIAIDAEEAIRARGLQEAWNVQYADSAEELLDRADAAIRSGRMEDLDANWEGDVDEVIAAWTGPGPIPLLGGGYTQSGPDDRPLVLKELQAFRDNISQYKSAVGVYEGLAPRATEIIGDLHIFPEEEGYVTDEDLGGYIGELQDIEEALTDMPYIGMAGPGGHDLQERRDMLLMRVRASVREALHREQELELGPLGDVEGWIGDDLDGSTALLSTGMRPRPAGLGIAGDVVDGFVRGKRVPIGHKGIKTRHQAAMHVRSGGDVSDVPDEYLTHALLTNSSVHSGERFLRMPGYKTDIYVLRQRINQSADDSGEPDVYGQEGFVIKASTSNNEVSPLAEWAAAEVLHNLGFPMLPYRMSGPDLMNTRGESERPDGSGAIPSGRGATVVMEFAWNGHPIGEVLSPHHSTDGFHLSDFSTPTRSAFGTELKTEMAEIAAVGLEGRLMNWLARTLLGDLDGHPGNAISARAPDGTAGVVPIDLEGGFSANNVNTLFGNEDLATFLNRIFQNRTATPTIGGHHMDSNWRREMLQAIEDHPELEQRFETIIRTAVERFKMMLSDPNWVERLASAGPYTDLVRKRSLEEWRKALEEYAAEMLPKLGDIDGVVDALLGRVDGEDIVDTDPSVKEFDPSSDKMLAVMDYINTCLESAA